MSILPDLVRTPRLVLRRYTVDDAPALETAVAASIEHLRPWMPWIAFEPLPRADRIALIEGWERVWRDGGEIVLGMFLDGELVGGTGLHRRAGPDTLEIGYWVHADHVRRGYASEAAQGLTIAALSLPGITRVEIHHDAANLASRRVPESLGFRYDGERPDEPTSPGDIGIDVAWSVDASWRPPG